MAIEVSAHTGRAPDPGLQELVGKAMTLVHYDGAIETFPRELPTNVFQQACSRLNSSSASFPVVGTETTVFQVLTAPFGKWNPSPHSLEAPSGRKISNKPNQAAHRSNGDLPRVGGLKPSDQFHRQISQARRGLVR